MQHGDKLPSPLYHGSRNAETLMKHGLCVPSIAKNTEVEEFDWIDLVVGSYSELSDQQLKPIIRYANGKKITNRWLKHNTSLAWFTELPNLAETYGQVVITNMSKIPYLWWFRDEYMPWSYVLVLPTTCPQSKPGAFKLLKNNPVRKTMSKPNLLDKVKEFLGTGVKLNPTGDDVKFNEFLSYLKSTGNGMNTWVEADWYEAIRRFGVTEEEIGSYMEDVASWGVDD